MKSGGEKMKKVIALVIAVVLLLATVACSADKSKDSAGQATSDTSKETTQAKTTTESSGDGAGSTGLKWPTRETLHVGFSQADLANSWRTAESDDMKKVAEERGYKITITNAEGDTEKQISDVESLLAQGCNVIVIVCIDADAVKPALDLCKKAGVPVFLKARGANAEPGVDYVSFIASDFVWEGEQAGMWIANACKEKGIDPVDVVVIQGIIGGTDVRDRGQGFYNAAEKAGNFNIVAEQPANWSRAEAQEVVQNILQSTGGDIDAIYCMNDEMALGAVLALKANNLKVNEDVFVVGVDGLLEAFDAIKSGDLSATVTCTPKYANTVFDAIETCIDGGTVDTYIPVPDVLVDATNVDQYYHLGF